MGGLLLGHCDSEELRTQGAQILSTRLWDAPFAPVRHRRLTALAKTSHCCRSSKSVDDGGIGVWVL